ncbi:hypothetical protein B7494_g3747 [Chlorociboria aeruginascens]|nr:hypothetical protein B7494_g3747 [Chlorociboria aeruginascens]
MTSHVLATCRIPAAKDASSAKMPMKLEGSCQCGGVMFTLESHTPVPYQLCACSICRKCGGYSGSVNLGGIAKSLKILKGEDLIKYEAFFAPSLPGFELIIEFTRKYVAIKDRGKPNAEQCTSERNFCSTCSSMLWLWDKSWPELIHPFASAIDTDMPVPEEMVCVKADSKPGWSDLDVSCEPDMPINSWIPEAYNGKARLVIGLQNGLKNEFNRNLHVLDDGQLHVHFASWTIMAAPRLTHVATLIDDIVTSLNKLSDT